MKKTIILLGLVFILCSFLVASASYTFRQGEKVNFRFRCFDTNNSYCPSTTQLLISIEYPDGSNAIDNGSMSYNYTYFNHTLPTDQLGNYPAIISSPTDNGTVSEFTYSVTPSGDAGNVLGYFIIIIALAYGVGFIGFFGKNEWISVIGGLAMMGLGLYIALYGIDIYRNFLTTSFSYFSIGLGAIFTLVPLIEMIQRNY